MSLKPNYTSEFINIATQWLKKIICARIIPAADKHIQQAAVYCPLPTCRTKNFPTINTIFVINGI